MEQDNTRKGKILKILSLFIKEIDNDTIETLCIISTNYKKYKINKNQQFNFPISHNKHDYYKIKSAEDEEKISSLIKELNNKQKGLYIKYFINTKKIDNEHMKFLLSFKNGNEFNQIDITPIISI